MSRDITTIYTDHEACTIGMRRFAHAMKRKLTQKRDEECRCGWNSEDCDMKRLRRMFREHVKKGDMVDIANLAMMIWNREHPKGRVRAKEPQSETPR